MPRLPVGKITGHRGAGGEVTVRVGGRDASLWVGVRRIWVGLEETGGRQADVEASRSYDDRWVIKLVGIDEAGSAAGLRGMRVWVDREDAPELPEGRHYYADLVDLEVRDESGRALGRVVDVQPTGGADLLRVQPVDRPPGEGSEVLIPLVPAIVLDVDLDGGTVLVRLPDGLWELNR